jgi:hypothetical protein
LWIVLRKVTGYEKMLSVMTLKWGYEKTEKLGGVLQDTNGLKIRGVKVVS